MKSINSFLFKIGAIAALTGICLMPLGMSLDLEDKFNLSCWLTMSGIWICGIILILKSK